MYVKTNAHAKGGCIISKAHISDGRGGRRICSDHSVIALYFETISPFPYWDLKLYEICKRKVERVRFIPPINTRSVLHNVTRQGYLGNV